MVRKNTPCNIDNFCPYGAQYSNDCEWYCGADEPEDNPTED